MACVCSCVLSAPRWPKLLPQCAQGCRVSAGCRSVCSRSSEGRAKASSQWVHRCGRSPAWSLWWLCSCASHMKVWPHEAQAWGRSPVWMRWCVWLSCLKPLPHCVHRKARSPVCTARCRRRLAGRRKLLPQSGHRWGFLPEWVCRWALNTSARAKVLPQWAHRWRRSPLWPRWWWRRAPGWWNDLPHSGHTWGRSPEWTRAWALRLRAVERVFPHCSQP
uniref:Uncharacterized protein n=1 Tax=Gadus morhua TaxID=8049 RepID=A0A8C4Z7Y1_GADMO